MVLSFATIVVPILGTSCAKETSNTVYSGNQSMFLDENYKPELYDSLKGHLDKDPSYIITNLGKIINQSLLRDTIYLFIWNEIIGPNRNPEPPIVVNSLNYSFTNLNIITSLNKSFTCDFTLTIKYSITRSQIPVYYESVWTSTSNIQYDGSRLESKQQLTCYADPSFTIKQEFVDETDFRNIGPSWGLWNTFHNYYKLRHP